MDGIGLAIRFSYMPNALRYCGPKEANMDFLSYVSNGNKKIAAAVKADLKRFEGLYPYLSAIAAKANKPFTDYSVIEAYWLGNNLLDRFGSSDMKAIINALAKRGLPASVAKERLERLPKGMFPHHNFNVCYIGVGQTTGSVPTTLENMNSCMTSSGIVKEIKSKERKLVVAKRMLEYDHGKLILGNKLKEVEAEYLPQLLPKIKSGDAVALHWNFAAAILTKQQSNNLNNYTKKLLDVMSF